MKKTFYITLLFCAVSIFCRAAYPLKTIASEKINNANGVLTTQGDSVTFIGVLQSINFTTRGLEFSIFDATGGIIVLDPMNTWGFAKANKGDKIRVRGIMKQFVIGGATSTPTGLTIINPDSNIAIMSRNNKLKPAISVTQFDEENEGDLVALDSVVLKDPKQWVTNKGSVFSPVTVYKSGNPGQTYNLQVLNNIILNMQAPSGIFSVSGIQLQADNSSPFLSNYYLAVTEASAFTVITSREPILHKIIEVKSIDANGIGDSTKNATYCYLKGVVESPAFSTTGLDFSLADNTGAITVYSNVKVAGYTPEIGDSLFIRGTITMLRVQNAKGPASNTGMISINPDSIHVISANNKPIPSRIISKPLYDSLESSLVTIKNVQFKNPASWDTMGKAVMYINFYDSKNDSFEVAIYRTDSLFKQPKLSAGNYTITGIVRQRDLTAPFLQFYYLRPRYIYDISSIAQKVTVKSVKAIDQSGKNIMGGLRCVLQGTVQSGSYVGSGNFFSLADNTGAIIVSSATTLNYTAKTGDEVVVRGTIAQQNGLTVINADSIGYKSGNNKPRIQNIIVARLLEEDDEAYLVGIGDLRLKDSTEWNKNNVVTRNGVTGFEVTALNTYNDEYKILVSNNTDLFNEAAPNSTFRAYGVVIQDDPQQAFSNYILLPRSKADIELGTTVGIDEVSDNITMKLYPNPAAGNLHISLGGKMLSENLKIEIVNITGQSIFEQSHIWNNSGGLQIPVNNLSPGIYTVKIYSAENTISSSFIKL